MTRKFITVLLLMLPFYFASAQTTLVPYKWDAFGVIFQLPENMGIKEISDDYFVAENLNVDDPFIEITAVEIGDSSRDERDEIEIDEDLIAYADDQDIIYNPFTSKGVQRFSNSGLQGYYFEGEQNGTEITIVELVSKRSDIVVFVRVTYEEGLEDLVNNMIKSITMNK